MKESEFISMLADKDIEDLQRQLAQVDLLEIHKQRTSFIELLILPLNHIKVRMRPDKNHKRPHFHIEYKKEYSASYALNDDFSLLAGKMPNKYEKPIIEWAQNMKGPLLDTWNALKSGKIVNELVIEKKGLNK